MRSILKMGGIAAALCAILPWPSHSAMLHLTVRDPEGAPIAGANVSLPAATDTRVGKGAATGLDGMAVLHDISGALELTISCVGYGTQTLPLVLPAEGHISRELVLQPSEVQMNPVTIVGRRGSGIDIKGERSTEILSGAEAAMMSMDGSARSAMGSMSGVDTRPCGLCGSAGVGLQGLDPNYTEIRVDGLALMSGVGALYGMDAISVSSISSLALTKGTTTAGSGGGAIAGSVNFNSQTTVEADTLQFRFSLGDGWRHGAGMTLGQRVARTPLLLNLDWQSDPGRLDRNADQLTDTPQLARLAGQVTTGWLTPVGNVGATVAGIREHRFAGDTQWEDADRGSSTIYGRDIRINRAELRMNWSLERTPGRMWSGAAALVDHHQDSWYGATPFDATQRRLLIQAGVDQSWLNGMISRLQLGWMDDNYMDGLPLPTDRHDRVPSASFSQSGMTGPISWESGLRLEKQEAGWIPLLRGSLAMAPASDLTVRLSAGQGYRQINLFSLDKAVHAGFDHIQLPEQLEPERSLSLNLGLQHRRAGLAGRWQGDLSFYAVEFREKAILRYTREVGHLLYGNAREAYSRGVEARADWIGWSGWHLGSSITAGRVRILLDEGWADEELTGTWTSSAVLGKRGLAGSEALLLELRLRAFGPQAMPEGRGREHTPTWAVLDLGLEHRTQDWAVGLDMENALDYVQPDNPLAGGIHEGMLDSALIYGPLIGRRFRVRAELNL